MTRERITSILEFLKSAEQLKNTYRSTLTSAGRSESVAEHTWQLCLMVMLFESELEGIDRVKLMKLCIIHDLGEVISGDIPAIYQNPEDDKADQERIDFITLCDPLPADLKAEMLLLWDEYDRAETIEAQFAKGFDKIETILQLQNGADAPHIDHPFNLTYGIERTNAQPLLKKIREIVDEGTRARIS